MSAFRVDFVGKEPIIIETTLFTFDSVEAREILTRLFNYMEVNRYKISIQKELSWHEIMSGGSMQMNEVKLKDLNSHERLNIIKETIKLIEGKL